MEIAGFMVGDGQKRKKRYGPPPPAIAEAISEVHKSRATGIPSERVVARVASLLSDFHPKDIAAKVVSHATAVDRDLYRWRNAICRDNAANIHRMVFVRAFANGLTTDITTESLSPVFTHYGPVEKCRVAVDKATGCSRGLGYLLFQTADAAREAVKEPIKMIGNTSTYSQFPYSGSYPTYSGRSHPADTVVYILNCPKAHSSYTRNLFTRLFKKFGNFVDGPIRPHVLEEVTILFYSTAEEAKEAVKDSCKMLGNHQMQCSLTPNACLLALEKRVLDQVEAAISDGSGGYPVDKVLYFSHQVSFDDDDDASVLGKKVKDAFAQFGEIAAGPVEVYADVMKDFRFSCFIYKTQEGVQAAIQEPDKVVEGYQLHCDLTPQAILKEADEFLQGIVKKALKGVVKNKEFAVHARKIELENQFPAA